MRRLWIAIVAVSALLIPGGRAEALTIRDVIELTRAGVGDEVLLALIEVDRSLYAIDTTTLKQLKAAGVSERVMVALVRSGREIPPEPVVPAVTEEPQEHAQDVQPPQVVVIDHRDAERVREVLVPYPIYVPVVPRSRHRTGTHAGTIDASTFVPFQTGPPPARPTEPRKTEPVYWGFGGKLRPDAWKPDVTPHDRRK